MFGRQHRWESVQRSWCCHPQLPGHPPSIPVLPHACLWDTSHLPEQESGDNQPGLFSGFLFFFFLSRIWLIKMPVWENHVLPRDDSQGRRVSSIPAWRHRDRAPPVQPPPPLMWGHLGQGLFIDTAPSSLPLPEETAPGGDGPDLAVLVDIPPGTVLSGNRRPPGVSPLHGVQGRGTPAVTSLEGSRREANLGRGTGERGGGGIAQFQPLLGPRHLWVGCERVCPPPRALGRVLPASLMGGSCFSQRR